MIKLFISLIGVFILFDAFKYLLIKLKASQYKHANNVLTLGNRIKDMLLVAIKQNEGDSSLLKDLSKDKLDEIVLISSLTTALDEVTKYYKYIRAWPFYYVKNSEEIIKNKFQKYQDILNKGYQKYLA